MYLSEHWIKVTWKNYRYLCSFSLTQRSCQIWTRENQICAVSYNFPWEAKIISVKRSLQLLRLRSTALSATNTGSYGRLQLLAADAAAVYLHLAVQILCCPGEPYLTLLCFFFRNSSRGDFFFHLLFHGAKISLIIHICLQVFEASKDLTTVVKNILKKPVQARYVRFQPLTFYSYPCVRIEIFAYY